MPLLTLLKRMNSTRRGKWVDWITGKPIAAHDFRATFRTRAEEVATVSHAVIEQAMGYQVGTKVERGRSERSSAPLSLIISPSRNFCVAAESGPTETTRRRQLSDRNGNRSTCLRNMPADPAGD